MPKKKKPAASAKRVASATSPRKKTVKRAPAAEIKEANSKAVVGLSPVAKLLAEPELPELKRENRARLQMQAPTKLFFYWSVKEDPWALLRKAFGSDTGSYTLVLKLVERRSGTESVLPADAEGSWWFDVEPEGEYRAEIGFYAVNRPYFRIIYSNTVETPRQTPSPRAAAQAEWRIASDKFSRVLEVAGFTQDALDVAMAGDDPEASRSATHAAFQRFIGGGNGELDSIADEDMRYAIMATASGQTLENMRWNVSQELFSVLQANADKLDDEKAKDVLREYFEVEDSLFEDEQIGPAVYGASLVNFPRRVRPRPSSLQRPSYRPESSHSYKDR